MFNAFALLLNKKAVYTWQYSYIKYFIASRYSQQSTKIHRIFYDVSSVDREIVS